MESLIEQLVESIRRIDYIRHIHRQNLTEERANPASELFDPLMAASLFQRAGDLDEASWLVFLSVHFGKNHRAGWQLTRHVYGALGAPEPWSWDRTRAKLDDFERWLQANQAGLKPDGVVRFGNHRKYESIGEGSNGTGAVVRSYVGWVIRHGDHGDLFAEATQASGGDQHRAFDYLYRSMSSVMRFGRTARFDYLTMLAKLELASIEPGIAYLRGSTGPLRGAQLLFGGRATAALDVAMLEQWVAELGAALGVNMQVMEDALCNWQKSPLRFIPFRG